MAPRIRVVSWNSRSASLHSAAWDYLIELDPDIAILQDFRRVPERVLEVYSTAPDMKSAIAGDKAPRYFAEVLAKGEVSRRLELPASAEWIERELHAYKDFLTPRYVTLRNGISLSIMSVYSPAFAIGDGRLDNVDTSSIRLPQHKSKIFITELLWGTLREMNIQPTEHLIVAGDFNSSETFDIPKPRGNREITERLNRLGLTECLRSSRGKLTPTYRTPRGGKLDHQLDHMYITNTLVSALHTCNIGPIDRVFGSKPTLSDHLPIVAEFKFTP